MRRRSEGAAFYPDANLDIIKAVFNRMKGGDREKAPESRRCSGDGSRSEGYDRLSGESFPIATA